MVGGRKQAEDDRSKRTWQRFADVSPRCFFDRLSAMVASNVFRGFTVPKSVTVRAGKVETMLAASKEVVSV